MTVFFFFSFSIRGGRHTKNRHDPPEPNPPAVQDTTGRKKGGEFWSGRNLNALNENQLLFYCWMLISKPQTTARQQQQPQKGMSILYRPFNPESLLSCWRASVWWISLITSRLLFCVSLSTAFFLSSVHRRRATLMPSNNSPRAARSQLMDILKGGGGRRSTHNVI